MTDNNQPPAGENENQQQQQTGKTPLDTLPPDVQSYIDELRRENAKHRTAARTAEKAARDAEEKRMAEQQEWKTLAEARAARLAELEQIQAQAEEIQATFTASMEHRLKQVPSDVLKNTVEPIRAAMSPVQFSKWLDANMELLSTKKAPNLDAGSVSNSGTTTRLTPAELQMAQNMGISPDAYAKRKAEIEAAKQQGR